MPSDMELEATILIQEIADIIDENPISPDTIADVDTNIIKLGELRTALRRYDITFKTENLNKDLINQISQTLSTIKDYIKASKDCKSKIQLHQTKSSTEAACRKEQSTLFMISDVKRSLNDLMYELRKPLKHLTDAELIQCKKELPFKIDIINTVAKKYELILQTHFTSDEPLKDVKIIGELYDHMVVLKTKYTTNLESLLSSRDVFKHKLFTESKLNIHLEKFSGSDSTDYYTFKSNFYKLHERSTPKHLLPDLLKNNYLKGPALSMVKSMTEIDDIWKQLQFAYGDVKMMLAKKLKQTSNMDPLTKSKDNYTLAHSLSKIVTTLKELVLLAETHNIEQHLYYSDGLHRIYNLLDDARLSRWLRIIGDKEIDQKETWAQFIKFVEMEQKLQQQKSTIVQATNDKPPRSNKPDPRKHQKHSYTSFKNNATSTPSCFICEDKEGENNHLATPGPGGSKIIQYYTCMRFAELSPANRLSIIKAKGYCYQCLFPGADSSTGKHKDGKCQRDFVCPHQSHQQYPVRKHVLLCEEHKDSEDNKKLLERYKQRFMKNPNLPSFAKNISLSFHTNNCFKSISSQHQDATTDEEHGIFLFQKVNINGNTFTIFFDNGCSDFLIKHAAIKMLGSYARKLTSEAVQIGGVGNTSTCSELGFYNLKIPMVNGRDASFSGFCIEEITATFPKYPLNEVVQEIRQNYGGDPTTLPIPSSSVGGEVHIMIGMRYIRYHPKLIYQLPSGLGIYESVFANADGGQGIVGGPHAIFTAIQQEFFDNKGTLGFYSEQLMWYKMGIQVNPDVSSLSFPSQNIKRFELSESVGSEISYRCVNCRACKNCKDSIHQRDISIKEEVEQNIIDSSINIDLENQVITAKLPFVDQPTKLSPNKTIALKIYYQQLKKLSTKPNDKSDIIKSESKLQQLGFVDYVENLSESQQLSLKNSQFQNFIPWRAVWKTSSVSTPCRVVYDASHPTTSGYSLNDLLAKGQNNLNKLQEILIRWSIHKIAIHTDIRKMYNTIRLDEADWCFQRYIWQKDLDVTKIPKEKVIKTLIYGIRSSGNQSEGGLRAVANLFKDEHPKVNQIIKDDTYVDDCITGESTIDAANRTAEDLEFVINHGGFHLKGFTISGANPSPDLTDDGTSIAVGGMKWYPESDELSLNIADLNFSKKQRGKKPLEASNIIPKNLTRRHCTSKVAEIFDITGKLAPLIASFKLDLMELNQRQLDWDDTIPEELRPIWIDNFNSMKDIGEVRFKRAIIPADAISTDIQTLDFGDSSQLLVCTCIYARFELPNDQFSRQLVFARTRAVPKGLSLPRAELMASLINTHTGEIVRRSFGSLHKSCIKFTDSQIALHWITNDEKPLKQWVRNRVIEINRFTTKDQWHYVQTHNMIADLGTRRGATCKDVNQDSIWMNGFNWMCQPVSSFPIQSAQELRFSEVDVKEIEKERTVLIYHSTATDEPIDQIRRRYEFSKYLLDPNRFQFSVVIKIMGYVIRYVNNLYSRCIKKFIPPEQSPTLSNEEVMQAEQYYFRKGTAEVVYFLPQSKYENISEKKDGILMYIGRILPNDRVSIVGKFTKVMKDLSSTSFHVPILDRHSPIAYSIALDVHWSHPTVKHCGIETTLRYILKKCYVIQGRLLVKKIKKSCDRCRYLEKRTVEMAMGPVSSCNLTIAPAFFFTQLDLSGPYQSYSPQHKRTTVKIWLIVFCCCSTSAVKIKTMDDYSTASFIQAIIRFSSDHGFPYQLMCDEGSQLVKGCREMKVNIMDIHHKLKSNHRVNFQLCPVQGHNMHGKVERKIKEINLSIEKSLANQRLSILQWETLVSSISNQINNLPLAIGDVTGDFECLDLITPNRLLLGRNNERAIDGVIMCDNPTKIINENQKAFDAWFEIWLSVHVPKLMKQTKWFKSDQINVGDVVIFTKHDSVLSNKYTYGLVKELMYGDDNLPRKARIKYKNANEEGMRETFRSVRGLVVIHGVEDCDLMYELGKLASEIDSKSKM